MTQDDRGRLVALRKAEKKIITQQQAAGELGLSVRQVKRQEKRLVRALRKHFYFASRGTFLLCLDKEFHS